MFQEIEGMLQRVTTGEIDSNSVGQSASNQVNSMDHQEVQQHLETAAANAQQNGQPDIAQQIVMLLANHRDDPQSLKSEAVSLIEKNPQILAQFEPEFAKRILGQL